MIKPLMYANRELTQATHADVISAMAGIGEGMCPQFVKKYATPLYGQDAIDQLTTERDVLARRLEKLDTLLRKPDVEICEARGHHEAGEPLLEFEGGLWYTPEGSYLDLDDALEALVP